MDEKLISQLSDEVKGVAKDLEKFQVTAEDVQKTKAEMADLAEKSGATAKQLDVLAKDVAQYRKLAEENFGKSGAMDYRQEFSKFVKVAYHKQKGKSIPEYLQKAAADYVGSTDAQGGYFVPEVLRPTIIELTEVHGTIWPYLNKVIVKPGQDTVVPYDSTLPTMTWRPAQGGSGTEDAGPIAFGADTINAKFLHDYVKFANELLESADIAVADAFAMRMISKGVRAIEYGVLQGDDSGTHPHDGVFVATSVNDQTDLATPTFALMANFIGEAIADHEGAADTTMNQIITTPAVANVLASEAVGASELTGMLTWGSPRDGVPARIMGYDFIMHPGAYETNHRVAMAPLGKVTVGWTGNWKVDFNPFSGWTSNETWMMVSTHADYVLGNPDMYSKADVTALA